MGLVRLRDAAEAGGVSTGRRACGAGATVESFQPRSSPNYRKFSPQDHHLQRMETGRFRRAIVPLAVGDSRRRPAVLRSDRTSVTSVRTADSNSATFTTRCRSSGTTTTHSPLSGRRSIRLATGWLTPMPRGRRAITSVLVKPSQETVVEAGRYRGPHAGRRSVLIDSLDVRTGHRRLAGHHRAFPAQARTTLLRSPGRAVAIRFRHALCRPEGDNATMFLSQLPLCGRWAICGSWCATRNSPDEIAGRHGWARGR